MEEVKLEKALEAMIDDLVNEMGEGAADRCFVLRRFQNVMLEMKSSNNAEILREIGYRRDSFDGAKCGECRRC
ncbi:MAG TPA: hypothetical protein VGK23_02380 [Methanomassiliicoccales archaeon]|jgi:hypothetical protein